jgi:DNA topoisomerase-1
MILIVAEKPNVAERIAAALGKARKKKRGKVSYFELDGITVASAVGHLYGVKQASPSSEYPLFSMKWAPAYTIGKNNMHTKEYIETLKSLSKGATALVSATDYDIEGAVIGYTAIRYACTADMKKAKRMKFSTLTTSELKHAFENLHEMDMEMVEAGLTRHELDWLWGMNTSKALTASVKKASGWFKLLSAGRVQTPTLDFLVRREAEIQSFKSQPFWILTLSFSRDGITVIAEYPEKIFDREKAEQIYNECLGKDVSVKEIEKDEYSRPPPIPFDLGLLQSEAYRCFGFTPKRTQEIAQKLYENSYISYPRTSSQKLPEDLGFKSILESLSKKFPLAFEILKTSLVPRQGKKEDPAHPAIYPTGELPKKLDSDEGRLYDLIVSRFMAVFAPPSQHESTKLTITTGPHDFFTIGRKTLSEGWMRYYKYSASEDVSLPPLSMGERVELSSLNLSQKETKPPPRYNPSSVIKQMEKLGIGTKATRASILDILYERKYIEDLLGRQIAATSLGKKIVEALETHCPRIVSVRLTRFFEHEMELVARREKRREEVLAEAELELKRIFMEFKVQEEAIGKTIVDALSEKKVVSICSSCRGDLQITYSPKNKSRFIGCSNYPECKITYPLPARGKIAFKDEVCDACGAPILKGRHEYCINPECPKLKKQEEFKVGKCMKCGGELRLKFSPKTRSHFIGCSNYPECRNTLSLPAQGPITPSREKCPACSYLLFSINGHAFCLNPDCPKNKPPSFGTCPKCGGELRLMFSRRFKKPFIGCSGYPSCKNAFSVPTHSQIEPTKIKCTCGLPKILIDGQERCLNVKCASGE